MKSEQLAFIQRLSRERQLYGTINKKNILHYYHRFPNQLTQHDLNLSKETGSKKAGFETTEHLLELLNEVYASLPSNITFLPTKSEKRVLQSMSNWEIHKRSSYIAKECQWLSEGLQDLAQEWNTVFDHADQIWMFKSR